MSTLALLLLPACGLLSPGLDGDWEGKVQCRDASGSVDVEVALGLDKDGGGTFSGELDMVQVRARSYQGSPAELRLTVACSAELGTTGFGEQDLDYDIEIEDWTCELYQGDSLVGWGCAELGVAVDGNESDFGTLTWDGRDRIEVDDGPCQGELER